MHAQVALFDGFDPMDAVAPYEVLFAAGAIAGGKLTVELATAEGAREVPSGSGPFALRATALLDPERADLVVVPGASASGEPMEEAIGLALGTALETGLGVTLRTAMAKEGLTMATVCGGSMLLAMAGLVAGRHAVTHPRGMGGLAAAGALPVDARVVDEGDLVTAGGVTSGLDLGLHLVERELGPRIAHAVETLFDYDRRGVVWQARGLEPVGS